jgi:hypothetical protein
MAPIQQQMVPQIQQGGGLLGGGMDDFLGGGSSGMNNGGATDLLGMNIAPAAPMAPVPIQQPVAAPEPAPKADKFGGLVSLDG